MGLRDPALLQLKTDPHGSRAERASLPGFQLQLAAPAKIVLSLDEMRSIVSAPRKSALSASVGINTSAMLIVCSTSSEGARDAAAQHQRGESI